MKRLPPLPKGDPMRRRWALGDLTRACSKDMHDLCRGWIEPWHIPCLCDCSHVREPDDHRGDDVNMNEVSQAEAVIYYTLRQHGLVVKQLAPRAACKIEAALKEAGVLVTDKRPPPRVLPGATLGPEKKNREHTEGQEP